METQVSNIFLSKYYQQKIRPRGSGSRTQQTENVFKHLIKRF